VLSTERASLSTPRVQAAATAAVRSRLADLAREHESQLGLSRLQLDDTRTRLANTLAERGQLETMIALQQERVAGAETTHAAHDKLRAEGFMPAAQVDLKKNEVLDQRARLGDLLRNRASLDRDAARLRLDVESAALKSANERSRYDRERAQLAQEAVESESRAAMTVTAPSDGIATAVLGESGQTIQSQTVLLTVLPQDAELQAKLLVPSRAIGFLAVGDMVSLRYLAFPYQRFGTFKGRVVEIPRAMVSTGEAEAPVAQTEAAYRVSVALEAQRVTTSRADVPLQNGMSLEADVWLERMTLLQWIFEPLLGVAGKV